MPNMAIRPTVPVDKGVQRCLKHRVAGSEGSERGRIKPPPQVFTALQQRRKALLGTQ